MEKFDILYVAYQIYLQRPWNCAYFCKSHRTGILRDSVNAEMVPFQLKSLLTDFRTDFLRLHFIRYAEKYLTKAHRFSFFL
jgi:hypothetical protein